MNVVATNIATPRTVNWKGKQVTTGIFKRPSTSGIYLEQEHVSDDHIADRRHHGGVLKACYLFSGAEYTYWKSLYPGLEWEWGMFGENVTLDSINEEEILIGNRYVLGNALVEATLPREPCFKLGIRFEDQKVLKDFIARERPGVYLKVIRPGHVAPGDQMVLTSRSDHAVSIASMFRLLFRKENASGVLSEALSHPGIPEAKKEILRRRK